MYMYLCACLHVGIRQSVSQVDASRLGVSGALAALLYVEKVVMSLVIKLAVWATGDVRLSSALLFLTTTACIVLKKGPMWFILSFMVIRTCRLAIFSVTGTGTGTHDSSSDGAASSRSLGSSSAAAGAGS